MQIANVSVYAYLDEAMVLIREGRSVGIPVVGSSMSPLLHDARDKVVLLQQKSFKPGDIILFLSQDGRYILHRIMDIRNGWMLTCGDGNTKKDGWTPLSRVLCKAVSFERNGSIYSLDSMIMRLFGLIWIQLYPIRPFLLRNLRMVNRFRQKIWKRRI